MALPTTNITTTLVSQAIGLASNNVGVLCAGKLPAENISASRINKWSKYKPVRYNNVAPNRGAGADWWRAQDGNCGLNIPVYANIADMFTALRNNTVMWDYLKPNGGATQPFRLGDFGGYEHSAQPPFVPMTLDSEYYASFGILGTSLSLRVQSQYELTVDDLGYTYNLGQMYFGVAICKKGTSGYKYRTQGTAISAGQGGALDISISSELGTYEVVYFLADEKKLSLTAPDIINTFIPIPNAMQTVIIKSTPISVQLNGTFGLQTANYTIKITNGYNTGLNVNGCSIAFRYGNKAPSDALVMGERRKSLGNIVVPAKSSVTLTGTITGVGIDYNELGGYLYFTSMSNTLYNTRFDL